jgi:hypothetical protein
LHRRAETLLQIILTGNKSLHDTVKAIDEFLLSQNEVLNFDLKNSNNTIRKQELGFYNLISSLENNGVSNASELTVFEIYHRIEYYDDLHRKARMKQNNS